MQFELPRIKHVPAHDSNHSRPLVVLAQGDITSAKTAAAVVAHFDGHHADLVVSDGAPDGDPLCC